MALGEMEPGPDKAEHYRQRADECLAMARAALHLSDKEAWLRIAEAWLRLIDILPDRTTGSGR
jgi:hypothetical protein